MWLIQILDGGLNEGFRINVTLQGALTVFRNTSIHRVHLGPVYAFLEWFREQQH